MAVLEQTLALRIVMVASSVIGDGQNDSFGRGATVCGPPLFRRDSARGAVVIEATPTG